MSPFEKMLLEEVAQVKASLREADESLSGFTLEVRASGRLDGEVEVSFEVSNLYGGEACKAGALAPALEEFLRRRGWSARNAPLCLPNVRAGTAEQERGTFVLELSAAASASDEIPF